MGNNTNAIGKQFEVFASKTLEQAVDASFVAAHPAAICFTPDGQIVFGGDVYSRQKTWAGTQEEYDAIEVKDANTTYYVNADEESDRKVYVGDALVLGKHMDWNFMGLLYGLGTAGDTVCYFNPLGSANVSNGKVPVVWREDNTFRANNVRGVGALGTGFWTDSDGNARPEYIEEITAFPPIIGPATELFMDMKNLKAVADGALRGEYDRVLFVINDNMDNSFMFNNCSSLKEVDLSGLEYSGDATAMFRVCSSLKEVKLPKRTPTATSYMFFECSSLNMEQFPQPSQVLADDPKDISRMFEGCTSLTGDDDGVFKLSSSYFSSVTSASKAFGHTRFKHLTTTSAGVNPLSDRLFDKGISSTKGTQIDGLFYGNNVLERVTPIICAHGGMGEIQLYEQYSPFLGCDNLVYARIEGLGSNANSKAYNFPLCGAPKWGSEDNMECVMDTLYNFACDANLLGSGGFFLLDQEVADRLTDEQKAQITSRGFTITTV